MTADRYTSANVQKIVDKCLQDYTFENDSPPPDDNVDPNIQTPPHQANVNAVSMETMKQMFEAYMDTNTGQRRKKKTTDLIEQGVDSDGNM